LNFVNKIKLKIKMPAELSESFINPFEKEYFNPKKEIENVQETVQEAVQEAVQETVPEQPKVEKIEPKIEKIKESIFSKLKKIKVNKLIAILIILLICYFLFKKINLNGTNEL
jgi:Fe2+ transport system protein B